MYYIIRKSDGFYVVRGREVVSGPWRWRWVAELVATLTPGGYA